MAIDRTKVYFCEDKETKEVYRAHYTKVIASIMSMNPHRDKVEAERLLSEATIDNPIDIGRDVAWWENVK